MHLRMLAVSLSMFQFPRQRWQIFDEFFQKFVEYENRIYSTNLKNIRSNIFGFFEYFWF